MKVLLLITAFVEGLTGISLLVAPALVISLLLGVGIVPPVGLLVGRIAGAAIFALAIVCWQVSAERGKPSRYIVTAMLFYNIAAALVLAYAHIGLELRGVILLPAIAGHLLLGTWCLVVLFQKGENR